MYLPPLQMEVLKMYSFWLEGRPPTAYLVAPTISIAYHRFKVNKMGKINQRVTSKIH